MAGFEDDFAKGEQEAARLVARMRAALDRAGKFENAAKQDAQLKSRLRAQTAAEARAGETTKPGKTPEQTVQQRIDSEKRLNKAIEERALLERRVRAETEANTVANRQAALQAQRGPGSAMVPYTGGGGRGGGQGPPRFFAQPFPEDDPFRRRLGAGQGPFPQIPQRTGPPYEYQKQLPAAGQTGGGAKFYEEEAKARRASATAGRTYAESSRTMDEGAKRLSGSLGREAAFMRSANLEFSRFGALSSEWIGAAGRGASTIQELGRQTTTTIGKFGGWLGAGALLFTALDTVKAIGHGALESASGVNQLERVMTNVDPAKAQAGFRQYSQEFNLPIGDVSQAAYELGKVFHDQDQAMEASRAVLYSVKVGELDTATASRYLIATINGFHLPASQLTTVFDQLNGAQNKFGITINDVEAGIAKSAGSFNAATTKGSPMTKYHELLALITTAQKATGQTGQVVGTAIQRAPNFLRQDKNKAELKKYGIDAGGDLNDIITQAFEKAQHLPGHKIAELASAIFGPQYGARIGTPLLQQFDLYKKVLAGTSKEATKNSGQRELNTLLGTYGERLKEVGVELESIGSGLAQSGFLDIFGLGLEALTGILHTTNSVLDAFNQLPGPLKTALSILIEMRLAVGALRKFNVGDNFAPGSAGRRIFSGPNRDARLYGEQLIGREEDTRRALESTNSSLVNSTRGVDTGRAALAAEEAEQRRLVQQGASQKEILAQKRNIIASESALAGEEATQASLAIKRAQLIGELNAIEARNTALKRNFNDTEAAALARRAGEPIPNSFNRGKLSAKELARQAGLQVQDDGTVVPAGPGSARATSSLAEGELRSTSASFRQAGAGWRTLAATEGGLRHPVESFKSSLTNAKDAVGKTYSATRSAIPTMSAVGEGFTKAAAGFRGLGRSMYDLIGGPLGLLIGGAFLAFEYGDDLGRALAGGQTEIENAEKIGQQVRTPQSKRNQYIDAFEKEIASYRRGLKEEGEPGSASQIRDIIEKGAGVTGAPSDFTYEDYVREKAIREEQRKSLRKTGRASGLPADIIKGQIERLKELDPSSDQYNRLLQNARSNALRSTGSDKELGANRKALRILEAKSINASGSVAAFFKEYSAVADKIMEKRLKLLSSLVSAGPGFATRKDVHQFTNASIIRGIRDLASNKAPVRAKGAETLQELPSILGQYEKRELEVALTLAKTQGGRERAYSSYIGGLQRGVRAVRASFKDKSQQIQGKLRKTEEEIREFEKQEKNVGPQKGGPTYGVNEATRKHQEQLRITFVELKERAKKLRAVGKEISSQQKLAERELKVQIQEQREAQIQEHVSVLGELGSLTAARLGSSDPVGQARATFAYAQKALSYVRDHHGSPQDLRQAQLAVLNARQGLEDAVRSEAQELASANEALAQARAYGDPIREAHAEIEKARSDLGLAKNQAERTSALAELLNAEHKLQEDRANVAIAGLQLEAAQTDNPVKQAAIKVREADAKLKQAHGKQAKLEARANRASAVREHRDAVAQAAIENVEFQADLGRITADQEIAAYTRLLRTLKLSKQARRSLIQKIHSLQEEASGNLELTVGNIQLPTLYDIRRAVQGGVNGGRGNTVYSDNSEQNVEINITGGDTDKVARVVDNTVNRKTKQSRRSAGMTNK